MPQLTLTIAAVLILVGVGGYVLTDRVSPTALIPAAMGIALIVLALWARRPAARKHAMHGVMLICVIGIAGTARGLMQLPTLLGGGDVARPAAVYSQSITAVALLLVLVMGIRSFIAARRSRENLR